MTDFTKDDLQNALYCIAHYQSCKWASPKLLKLENKIKRMIDTYCDHEWMNTYCLKCEANR